MRIQNYFRPGKVLRWFGVGLVCLLVCLCLTVPVAAQGPGEWTEYSGNPLINPSGSTEAYYPTVLYDGSATPFGGHGESNKYKLWCDKNLQYYVSDDGVTWTFVGDMSDGTITGLPTGRVRHPLVEYYASGFAGMNSGDNPSSATMYYRLWYWDSAELYSVAAMRYAESPDGKAWYNDQPLQNKAGGVPIVTGVSPDWNRGTYGPADVIYNSSATNTGTNPFDYTFAMYYDGTTGGDESLGLGYSSDGVVWEGYDGDADGKADPILQGSGSGWDTDYVSRATVIKVSDTEWKMWYSGGTGSMNHGIGYATSSDGIHWTKDAGNPILHKTDTGYPGYPWRNKRTYTPMVIDDGSGIMKMYFSGESSDPTLSADGVVIGYAEALPTEVWVDDDYNSTTPGWGLDHFDTIQDGIDAVAPGGTVWVADGTYVENLVISKPLNLYGSGTSTSTVYPAVSDPGACAPPALGNSQLVVVQADNVTISGFVFDGDNPNLTSGVVFGGADIDARNGIVTDPANFPGKGNNLKVLNCVVRNFFLRGVEARGSGTPISGIEYRHNTVSNVQGCTGNSLGLSLHTNATGKIWDNTVSNCDVGIFVHNGSAGEVIENTVSDCLTNGIGVNGNDAETVICFNTVTNGGTEGCIQAVSVDAPVKICCNEISGDCSGIIIYGGRDNSIEIYDNNLHNDGDHTGLLITTDLDPWGSEDSTGVNAWGNTITNYDKGVEIDSHIAGKVVTATVSSNDIHGNTTWNAINNDANSTLDATNNWWGSKNGPGATVSGNVLVDPWAQALVTLTPWRQEMYVCESTTLDIVITADELYGFQMILHFDPSNLEVTDAGWDDTWFHPDIKQWDLEVDNVNGTVKIATSQQYDLHPDPVSGQGRVAWIKFHCIAQSIDHITLSDLILANIEGEEILSTYASACIKNIGPQPGSIVGTVDLQGRANESGAAVVALPGGYGDTTNSAGNYTIATVPPGTYTVIVEMERYLDAVKTGVVVTSGGTTTLNQVKLLGGDANDDDIINILDLSLIGGAYGTSPPSDVRADINNDGMVNILDLVLAGGNYTKTSPVNWP